MEGLRLPLTLALAPFGFVALAAIEPGAARAQSPSTDLMGRLALHAAAFEQMRLHASYALDGTLDEIDGDGNVEGTRSMDARVEADGVHKAKLVILKYVEDGEDKTDDAREKQADAAKKPHKEHRMPFLASEQARYTFDEVEVDAAHPTHVRVTFVPKEPAEDTVEGSAWVDVPTGHVLTAGFKLSKPDLFVDYVNVTLEFGAETPLGPAVSRATIDGKGGLLFFRKHFRGSATLHDYSVTP